MVLVTDGQAGPVASEDEIVSWLRRHHPGKKVVLAVNKCESSRDGEALAAQFWGYGLEPLAVSAISGTGTGDLMERIMEVRRGHGALAAAAAAVVHSLSPTAPPPPLLLPLLRRFPPAARSTSASVRCRWRWPSWAAPTWASRPW